MYIAEDGCDPDDPDFIHGLRPRIVAHEFRRLGKPIDSSIEGLEGWN